MQRSDSCLQNLCRNRLHIDQQPMNTFPSCLILRSSTVSYRFPMRMPSGWAFAWLEPTASWSVQPLALRSMQHCNRQLTPPGLPLSYRQMTLRNIPVPMPSLWPDRVSGLAETEPLCDHRRLLQAPAIH